MSVVEYRGLVADTALCYTSNPFSPKAGYPRGGGIKNKSLWRLQVGPKPMT